MERAPSGWRRLLPWALVTLLVLVAGGCAVRGTTWGRCFPNPTPAYDPRAYQQPDCLTTNENTATFDKMTRFYRITLPSGASGLRYYSDDAVWNSPPVLYLRFSVQEGEVDGFLAGLRAAHTAESAASATAALADNWQQDGIDWTFAPSAPLDVYRFGSAGGRSPNGVVVVDRGEPTAVVYVIDSTD